MEQMKICDQINDPAYASAVEKATALSDAQNTGGAAGRGQTHGEMQHYSKTMAAALSCDDQTQSTNAGRE